MITWAILFGGPWTTRSSWSAGCTRSGSTPATTTAPSGSRQAETGLLINAAALIMICVFTAFVFGGRRVIAEYGVGLAAAVAIDDAFVLRTVLVPSLMHLLGRANWWLPAWLERILPRVSIEGTPSREPLPVIPVPVVPVPARAARGRTDGGSSPHGCDDEREPTGGGAAAGSAQLSLRAQHAGELGRWRTSGGSSSACSACTTSISPAGPAVGCCTWCTLGICGLGLAVRCVPPVPPGPERERPRRTAGRRTPGRRPGPERPRPLTDGCAEQPERPGSGRVAGQGALDTVEELPEVIFSCRWGRGRRPAGPSLLRRLPILASVRTPPPMPHPASATSSTSTRVVARRRRSRRTGRWWCGVMRSVLLFCGAGPRDLEIRERHGVLLSSCGLSRRPAGRSSYWGNHPHPSRLPRPGLSPPSRGHQPLRGPRRRGDDERVNLPELAAFLRSRRYWYRRPTSANRRAPARVPGRGARRSRTAGLSADDYTELERGRGAQPVDAGLPSPGRCGWAATSATTCSIWPTGRCPHRRTARARGTSSPPALGPCRTRGPPPRPRSSPTSTRPSSRTSWPRHCSAGLQPRGPATGFALLVHSIRPPARSTRPRTIRTTHASSSPTCRSSPAGAATPRSPG